METLFAFGKLFDLMVLACAVDIPLIYLLLLKLKKVNEESRDLQKQILELLKRNDEEKILKMVNSLEKNQKK